MKTLHRTLLVLLAGATLAACGLLPETRPQAVVSTRAPDAPDETQSRGLYLDVVRGLQEQGRWNASLAHLDAYEAQHPGDPAAGVLRADALSETGEEERARALYNEGLSTSYAPGAHAGLGFLAARDQRWEEAVGQFRQASSLRPTNVRYLNNLGYALLKTGKPVEARRALQRAYELDSRQPGVRNNLAIALLATGDEAAFEALLRSIGDPEERDAVRHQAEVWER